MAPTDIKPEPTRSIVECLGEQQREIQLFSAEFWGSETSGYSNGVSNSAFDVLTSFLDSIK